MSGSREYEGDPIDDSWQTAPWNRDGKTIEASDDNTEEHDMDTIEWPENATPKEELKDDQIAVIKKAARYRNIDNPGKLSQLAVGDKRSRSYSANVLKANWPERYWVDPEDSTDDEYLRALGESSQSESSREYDVGEDNAQSQLTKEDVKEIRIRARNGESIAEIGDSFPFSKKAVREAAKGQTWSHFESPPPVEYDKDRKKYVPKGLAREPGHPSGKEVHLSTQDLREQALSGKAATDIAEGTPASDKTIRHHLNGERCIGEPDLPPLEYNVDSQEWVIADKNDTEQATIEDTEPDGDPEDTEQPEHTGYEPRTRDDDTTSAWAYVAVATVIYGIYRLVRRLF